MQYKMETGLDAYSHRYIPDVIYKMAKATA